MEESANGNNIERSKALDELINKMKSNYLHRVGTQFDNAIFDLTVAGITRGKQYDVIDKSDKFIKIVLDDGKIGIRHINAFDIVKSDWRT